MKTRKPCHAVALFIAAAGLLLAASSSATVIYSDDFSGDNTAGLHGTTPDTTVGTTTWIAHENWKANGSIAQVSGNFADHSAFLPFAPKSGRIYTLTATLSQPTGTTAAMWAAIGFTNDTLSTADGNLGQSFWAGSNATSPWMLYRSTVQSGSTISTFTGPGTTGGAATSNFTGTQTMTIVLDTTAAQWTAQWFVGATSLRGPLAFATNPTITHVGFGREDGAGADFNSFSLTVIGEPDESFALTITPAKPPTTGFDLEWESRPGKLYTLHTSTDLATPVTTWDIQADNLPATPPKNLFSVGADGPRRFYAVAVSDAPPLFFANFEDGDGDFTVAPGSTGSSWEHGTPSADDAGGGFNIKSGFGGSNGAWGVRLDGPYAAGTETVLRSPVIDLGDLSEGVGAQLRFALALDMDPDASFVARVIDADTGDVIGEPLLTLTGQISRNWEMLGPFNLPTESIRIEWRFVGPNGTSAYLGAYLDEVKIELN